MVLYDLILQHLAKNIEITYVWPAPVTKRDEDSWIADTLRAYDELTAEDVETVFKWCDFKGTDEEAVVAAIKSLILPEDLPIGCKCHLKFTPK